MKSFISECSLIHLAIINRLSIHASTYTNTFFPQFIYLRWFSHPLKILINCIYKTNYLLNVNSLPSDRKFIIFYKKNINHFSIFLALFFFEKKNGEDIASVVCVCVSLYTFSCVPNIIACCRAPFDIQISIIFIRSENIEWPQRYAYTHTLTHTPVH